MKKTGIRKLTTEAFARYGSFASILEPSETSWARRRWSFTAIWCSRTWDGRRRYRIRLRGGRKQPRIIDCVEYHDYCGEAIICLDGDYLMHVAPACGKDELPYDSIEVFLLPRGTVAYVKRACGIRRASRMGAIRCIYCARCPNGPTRRTACAEHPEEHQIEVIDEFID
jgi:ureidoglycolate hydrolase